ncbi:hypothetical protein [uncultured Corynebacterium sp.]|nr:hypothetical protein [uncultured Corynebacterium sp.]
MVYSLYFLVEGLSPTIVARPDNNDCLPYNNGRLLSYSDAT